MALRLSTGLRNGMLNATGIKEALADGVIYVYSGSQPTTADAAATGTLLGYVTESAGAFSHGSATNGLEFDAPASGVLAKAAAETWQMVAIAAGTAGWFRFSGNPSDNQSSSSTLPRIDGRVAKSGGDLNLSVIDFSIGTPVTVDTFNLTMPSA